MTASIINSWNNPEDYECTLQDSVRIRRTYLPRYLTNDQAPSLAPGFNLLFFFIYQFLDCWCFSLAFLGAWLAVAPSTCLAPNRFSSQASTRATRTTRADLDTTGFAQGFSHEPLEVSWKPQPPNAPCSLSLLSAHESLIPDCYNTHLL